MSVILTSTWLPRGDIDRFEIFYPQMEEIYKAINITLSPNTPQADRDRVLDIVKKTVLSVCPSFETGRHFALEQALLKNGTHIHYVDMDRLLRWIETQPEEWQRLVQFIPKADFLVIGRTNEAFATHPMALQKPESIVNTIFSNILGKKMDFPSGSRAFSRSAAEFVRQHSPTRHFTEMQCAWPVIAYRAGIQIDYIEVHGLDYEAGDHFQNMAATTEVQTAVAEAYDCNPKNWNDRLGLALKNIQCGLHALQMELNEC